MSSGGEVNVLDHIFSQILAIIEDSLKSGSTRNLPEHCIKGKLRKKTRDLKSGDIILPKGCLKLDDINYTEAEFLKHVDFKQNSFITKVTQDSHYLLAIHLNRPEVYRDVLQKVEQQGSHYGHIPPRYGTLFINFPGGSEESSSLSYLRCKIVREHVKRLLEIQGYKVLNLESGDAFPDAVVCAAEKEKVIQQLQQKEETCLSHTEEDSVSVTLNLTDILRKHSLAVGKDGFNKNLDKVCVLEKSEPTAVLKDAICLEQKIRQTVHTLSDPVVGCVNIVTQAQAFKNQQALLVYHSISSNPLKQSQIVVGPVVAKKEDDEPFDSDEDLADEFCSMRLDHIREASEMRFGHLEEAEAESRLTTVVTASINMDVLMNAAHVSLQLDMSPSEDSPASSRTGAFVMYNTARLATLHAHFEQQVEKGVYPPLPAIADTDFSLLREQEEWELLFLYVGRYPEVLSESVLTVLPGEGRLAARVLTHKVSIFLASMCKCLSSYYSRYHILGGGEEHLLAKMFARLHLMKATHSVLLNALDLIGVQALDYL